MKYGKDDDSSTIPPTNLEQTLGNEPLGAKKVERLDSSGRFCLHFHSFRHRLVDPDGLSAKYVIDGLVLAGICPDDSAKEIQEITFSQEKIPTAQQEQTIIEIVKE